MKHRAATNLMLAMALVASACGGGESEATTTTTRATTTTIRATTTTIVATTPTTQESSTEDTTTTTQESGVTETSECLPTKSEVSTDPDREEVGEITERFNKTVQADCVRVSGGEDILAGGVVVTDVEGKTAFTTEFVDSCHLHKSSEVVVRPEDTVVFQVVDGEVLCTINPGAAAISFNLQDGTEVHLVPEVTTTMSALVTDSGSTTLNMITGFAAINQPVLGCATLAGPFQSLTLDPGLPPVITFFDIEGLDEFYHLPVDLARGSLVPPVVPPELLPGLSSTIAASNATMLVDGELIGESDSGATMPTLQAITLAEFELERPGRLTPIGRIPEGPISVPITPGLPGRTPSPTFGPGPVAQPLEPIGPILDLPVQATPLDELVTGGVDLNDILASVPEKGVALDILIDPQGRRWSLAYDATNTELDSNTRSQFDDIIQSGSYAAFYESTFDLLPDYGLLFPHMYGDLVPCTEAGS